MNNKKVYDITVENCAEGVSEIVRVRLNESEARVAFTLLDLINQKIDLTYVGIKSAQDRPVFELDYIDYHDE